MNSKTTTDIKPFQATITWLHEKISNTSELLKQAKKLKDKKLIKQYTAEMEHLAGRLLRTDLDIHRLDIGAVSK